MSIDESSILMDRALVTMCPDLPESLGLYNTAKDQLSLAAVRAVPLLEYVAADSRKLALLRDWMRAYEAGEDQPLSSEISMDSLHETAKRERKERERKLQEEKHAQLTSENAAEEDDKKRRKRLRKEKHKETKSKGKDRAKPKKEKKSKQKARAAARKRHDGDDEVLSIEESSNSSDESSSSSDSDSDSRAKKRKKPAGNLPPKEVVLSSDEDDEEPNDMFDTTDPDVYEVEKIIRKKTGESFGDPDLYEVKWEGYEETTWEPAANISKDLIDEYEGQPVREDVYTVQEIVDRRSKREPSTKLRTHQYKVKWVGYDDLTWEPADNLPHNLRRKFDQKYESRKRRRS